MFFQIVAKITGDEATYYNYPEQAAARKRLADMNGKTFDTLEEAEAYLATRGVKKEESWGYPTTGIAAPKATMIWFLRMQNPGYRIGGGFQLCKCNGTRYAGTHPGNIAGGLREIAQTLKGTKEGEALETYARDVEHLAKAAGIVIR